MRRMLVAVLVTAVCFAAPAAAWAATQGDFALALAQVLGLEATTDAQAVAALSEAQVAPTGGWQAAQPLTTEVIQQVERALGLAVSAGIIRAVQAEGAVDAAAASVDFTYTSSTSAGGRTPGSIPARPPIGGPQGSGEGREGSPFRP